MLVKLIFEDEKLKDIKEDIKKVDTKQLYFLEDFLLKERKKRKDRIFTEWLHLRDSIIKNN